MTSGKSPLIEELHERLQVRIAKDPNWRQKIEDRRREMEDRRQKKIDESKTPEVREFREIERLLFDYRVRDIVHDAREMCVISDFEEAVSESSTYYIRQSLEYQTLPLRGHSNFLFGVLYDALTKILSHDRLMSEHSKRNVIDCPAEETILKLGEALERLTKLAEKVLGGQYRVTPKSPRNYNLGTFEVVNGDLYAGCPSWGRDSCQKLDAVAGSWRAIVTNIVDCIESRHPVFHVRALSVTLEGFDTWNKSWEDLPGCNYDKCLGFFCSTGLPQDEFSAEDDFIANVNNCWIEANLGGEVHPNGLGVVIHAIPNANRIEVIRNGAGLVCAARFRLSLEDWQKEIIV